MTALVSYPYHTALTYLLTALGRLSAYMIAHFHKTVAKLLLIVAHRTVSKAMNTFPEMSYQKDGMFQKMGVDSRF
jgi:hypothetical protein